MLSLFFLGLMRMAPIIAMVPFLGAKVPAYVKMGLLLTLTFIMLPHMAVTSRTELLFDGTFIVLCVKEFFIGMLLAFLAAVPFYMAESAGILIDFQRGSSALQVSDPTTQEQTSDIGVLYNYVLIVIFYEINGPFYFFNALFDSYTIVPADGWFMTNFFSFHHPFWQEIWDVVNRVFTVSIQLAAPSLLSILMTEMFLGIANRLAPQVQIVFLGMSLKSLVGLALLCAAWFFILQQLNNQAMIWLQTLTKIIKTFSF